MGFITIETGGSFPTRKASWNATQRGHAHAVSEAIAYLSQEVLPEAIERDHRLHDEGAKPTKGFDREPPGYWYLYNLVYGIAAAAWEQEGRPVLR